VTAITAAARLETLPAPAFGAEVARRAQPFRPAPDGPSANPVLALWRVADGAGTPEVETLIADATAGGVVRLRAPETPDLLWPSTAGVVATLGEELRLRGETADGGRYDLGPAQTVAGAGTFVFPIGPVRGDVMESVGLHLGAMGDEVLALTVRLGFKMRHVTRAAAGLADAEAVRVVERATGTSTVAHVLAFCQAVESARAWEVPPRAAVLRSVAAELERVHSHLLDLASLANATGLPAAQQELLAARERALRANAALAGHRYLRGLVAPGGLAHDPGTPAWRRAVAAVLALAPDVERVVRELDTTPSFLDRLVGAGIVRHDEALAAGALGPVGRASGCAPDGRVYRPYAGYRLVPPPAPAQAGAGDARARWQVRSHELLAAFDWLERALAALDEGPVRGPRPEGATWGWGAAEGPRGEVLYAVDAAADGRVVGVWARTPSLRNWLVLPAATARRNVLQDVPIIDASFALSAAGADL
jgi:formate hydrogenlyase subunit 5